MGLANNGHPDNIKSFTFLSFSLNQPLQVSFGFFLVGVHALLDDGEL